MNKKQILQEGNQLKRKKYFDEAIEKYNELLQQDKKYIPALYQLALTYEKQKNFDRAIEYYQRVIRQQPNKSSAYARLARVMNSQGDIDGAIFAFQRAIKLDPGQASWVYSGLANVLYCNGDKDRAIEVNQKARKLNPKIPNITDKKVTLGKQGWLFLDNDSNQVNKQLNGTVTFSEEELIQWRKLIEFRKLKLGEQGISYFFFVAPTKGCVYPEYLPDHIQLSENRCVTQLVNDLAIHLEFKPIYPLSELIHAKTTMPVYSERETHWNDFGAFIGYRALLSQISEKHNVNLLTESSVDFLKFLSNSCDLGNKLGIKCDLSIKAKIVKPDYKCIFNNRVQNTGKLLVYENKNKELPKAIVFRDSFSSQLLKFLAGSFSRLVAVWQPNIDYSIVRDEKPDIVISQQAERFLIKIPDDIGGLTNREIVRNKLKVT